ncbi:nucleotide-binding universal stress UspA family protein [Pedobacter cryoconitis]|uniref:Nucleotide-binding universal stress UspA family protein n=1 Tax=Pedobacter cryoconitis TaxID=188932 RepID=A0A7W8ZQL2_9SPHI|nr:universal stress protein [Pedobacter cryoconitis]MBB5638386.1 nucleotide-binding universal stress UspA family protein [Pedobacter cryoconitis]
MMKTILVTTDFSAPSQTAARYALYLANAMKAHLVLCHAIQVSSTVTIASKASHSPDNFSSTYDAAVEQIQFQVLSLTEKEENDSPTTLVDYIVAPGSVTNVVNDVIKKREISLVVMGMFGAGAINRFLLGSNSQNLIDNRLGFPVLLVPFKEFPETVNKIAFASDLSDGDIGLIQSLASFACPFDAEILIVHISGVKVDQIQIDNFLKEVTAKINYHKIYYRHVEDKDINRGLNWIARNGVIDVFAMVHRKNNFPGNIFSSSYTQNLSRSIHIPLLVFSENEFPVF